MAWTSPEEQTNLYRLAKDDYTGEGEIVDLGCLLGATTIALARGLEKNKRIGSKNHRIHAYDYFKAEKWLSEYPGFRGEPVPLGNSYYPLFLENIQKLSRFVAPYPYDLLMQQWHGAPIACRRD
jgi:hypothetical protein